MTTLYLTTAGATLSARSRCLEVRRRGEDLARCPTLNLARVVVLAPTHLTSEAIGLCAREGVELVIVPRGPRGAVRIGLAEDALRFRAAQHLRSADAGFRLRTARAIVTGKLRNQQRYLGRCRGRHELPVRDARKAIGRGLASLDAAQDLPTLRGLEGNASAAYYSGLRHILNPEYGFDGRNRRPPRDPANALLSFAYTLLAAEAVSAVTGCGLEPALGCYHDTRRARPALALDLMEEFRAPIADALVVAATSRRMIAPNDFRPMDGGVHMRGRARRRLITAYEAKMAAELRLTPQAEPTTLRTILRAQATQLALAILGDTEYESFRMP